MVIVSQVDAPPLDRTACVCRIADAVAWHVHPVAQIDHRRVHGHNPLAHGPAQPGAAIVGIVRTHACRGRAVGGGGHAYLAPVHHRSAGRLQRVGDDLAAEGHDPGHRVLGDPRILQSAANLDPILVDHLVAVVGETLFTGLVQPLMVYLQIVVRNPIRVEGDRLLLDLDRLSHPGHLDDHVVREPGRHGRRHAVQPHHGDSLLGQGVAHRFLAGPGPDGAPVGLNGDGARTLDEYPQPCPHPAAQAGHHLVTQVEADLLPQQRLADGGGGGVDDEGQAAIVHRNAVGPLHR